MSVVKSKRKESEFEVFHNLNKLRTEITELLLYNFGYDMDKAIKKVEKRFGGRTREQLSPKENEMFDKIMAKNKAFDDWFIADERKVVIDCLRSIVELVYIANNIYPTCQEELIERRLYQDKAIGQCYRLVQELQYAIEILPVDVNKYLRFGDRIQKEIDLIKAWRKSDNKFKKKIYKEN